mmetsp:Transcript_20768/g.59329  ORF Transcript_20768/g.59329 Transcript_20768/m.59329 type:complete len:197 (-) Transcript_20768:146-736(-)
MRPSGTHSASLAAPGTAEPQAPPFSAAPMAAGASAWRALIFQDVDGVLNHSAHGDGTLDLQLLRNLGHLVRKADAAVVVSSAWRKSPRGFKWLLETGLMKGAGIPRSRIVGATPSLCADVGCRAQEIRCFLQLRMLPPGIPWIAIDDQDLSSQDPALMTGQHFVRTDARCGLTLAKVHEAEALLLPKAQSFGLAFL